MKVFILSIILLFGSNLFSQDIKVIMKVDDFTGDTLLHTKRWELVAGGGLSKYFKIKGGKIKDELFLSFAILTSAYDATIEKGNNILFKMSNDEILYINISETERISRGFSSEFKMNVNLDWKTYKVLTSSLDIKAIRVITNSGAYNYTVTSENGDAFRRVLNAVENYTP